MTRDHKSEELIEIGKLNSSKKPKYGLIPWNALVALADRYQLGQEKHRDRAYNQFTNQDGLLNEEWVIARAEHVIHHALLYIAKFKGLIPDDGDDDAGAITWGGTVLSESKRLQSEEKVKGADIG